jgi:outer membrane receptor for Fe3+-dicitrate
MQEIDEVGSACGPAAISLGPNTVGVCILIIQMHPWVWDCANSHPKR